MTNYSEKLGEKQEGGCSIYAFFFVTPACSRELLSLKHVAFAIKRKVFIAELAKGVAFTKMCSLTFTTLGSELLLMITKDNFL